MQQPEKKPKEFNKDLILREKLALERTVMANDRTFLSFLRTALYFTIAGLTINELVDIRYGDWVEIIFWILAFVVLCLGIVRYLYQKKKIRESRKHIGGYVDEWEDVRQAQKAHGNSASQRRQNVQP